MSNFLFAKINHWQMFAWIQYLPKHHEISQIYRENPRRTYKWWSTWTFSLYVPDKICAFYILSPSYFSYCQKTDLFSSNTLFKVLGIHSTPCSGIDMLCIKISEIEAPKGAFSTLLHSKEPGHFLWALIWRWICEHLPHHVMPQPLNAI